jgi:hypothetical protein
MAQEKSLPDQDGLPPGDFASRQAASARHRKALTTLRRARKILAVWHPPENRYLYPPFQFNEADVISEVAPLLAYLHNVSSGSGWSEIEWFVTPHALLGAQTPAEVLPCDPASVLDAATIEFSEDREANW